MSPFARFAARDLGIAALTAAAWRAERGLREGRRSSTIVSVAADGLTASLGFFAHEWGHLGGALATVPFLVRRGEEQPSRLPRPELRGYAVRTAETLRAT